MSETILRAISGGKMIDVSGLPWQNSGETRPVSISSLASKILCQRHNSALSPLDAIAGRLFDAFDQIDREFRHAATASIERVFLFNGHDIERWMLKVLCGVGHSGNAATADLRPIRKWTPPELWQRVLFGTEPFPNGWGMYFDGLPGDVLDASRDVKFAPVFDGTNMLGAIMWFNNYCFLLVMADVPNRTGTLLERATFRPKELCMTTDTAIKMISFGWDILGDEKCIHIQIRPKVR